MSATGVVTLYASVPGDEEAVRIAEALIGERLAACVNILPRMLSVYRWQGRIESAQELALLVKTSDGMAERAIARIKALHSHEVPQIVQWPVDSGHAPYLKWVKDQLG